MKPYWTEEKIKSAKYDDLKKENHELAKMNDIIREEAQVIQLQAENEARKFLKRIADLEAINKSHQKLNGELREDNKKLAKQVDDYVNQLRKAGVL